MDVFSLLPGWAWALLILIGIVFVYGIFNRRWIEEEAREKAKEKALEDAKEDDNENAKEVEVPAPSEPHVPVSAATLSFPSQPGSQDGKLPLNGNDDPSHPDQE